MAFQSVHLPQTGILLYESKHRPGEGVHHHYHDVYQLLYVLEGNGQISINGTEQLIHADHTVMIAPHCTHAVRAKEKMTILVLAFHLQDIQAIIDAHVLQTLLGQSRFMRVPAYAAGEIRRSLRKMLYEQAHGGPLSNWAMNIYLMETLLHLAKQQEMPDATNMNQLRAERIQQYITTHYYEALSTEELAKNWDISARYMNRLFKERYGMTPMQYLTDVRIDRAKTLLTETSKDITSICFEVGYETVSTFYRTFKNRVSMSPNQYRQSQT